MQDGFGRIHGEDWICESVDGGPAPGFAEKCPAECRLCEGLRGSWCFRSPGCEMRSVLHDEGASERRCAGRLAAGSSGQVDPAPDYRDREIAASRHRFPVLDGEHRYFVRGREADLSYLGSSCRIREVIDPRKDDRGYRGGEGSREVPWKTAGIERRAMFRNPSRDPFGIISRGGGPSIQCPSQDRRPRNRASGVGASLLKPLYRNSWRPGMSSRAFTICCAGSLKMIWKLGSTARPEARASFAYGVVRDRGSSPKCDNLTVVERPDRGTDRQAETHQSANVWAREARSARGTHRLSALTAPRLRQSQYSTPKHTPTLSRIIRDQSHSRPHMLSIQGA